MTGAELDLGKMSSHERGPGASGELHASAPEKSSPRSACTDLDEGPYAAADLHLRALAGAAEGFGSAAIGGLNGKVYHVTSLAGIRVAHKLICGGGVYFVLDCHAMV
jgi:hypothetical protein